MVTYKILRSEKGIIPMALIEAQTSERIMKIGTSCWHGKGVIWLLDEKNCKLDIRP